MVGGHPNATHCPLDLVSKCPGGPVTSGGGLTNKGGGTNEQKLVRTDTQTRRGPEVVATAHQKIYFVKVDWSAQHGFLFRLYWPFWAPLAAILDFADAALQLLSKCLQGIGTSVRRSSRSAFGRSTGNDVSGHYKRHYFLFFFLFFLFSSPSSTFLIEGVLGSKNLFSES